MVCVQGGPMIRPGGPDAGHREDRGGGDTYYLEAVAGGADEYYRGVGEAPGEWAGAAAIEFGLSGEVDPDDLRAVWNGLDPQTGSRLGNFPNRTVHVFDLTFKAPKSVSILFDWAAPRSLGRCATPTTPPCEPRSATWSARRSGRGPARVGRR